MVKGDNPMKITYDPTIDAAYIYLVSSIDSGEVYSTASCMLKSYIEINIDFDRTGKILGFEILDAGNVLPDEILRQAS
jgi:uncharacterized protein YuzE